MTKFVYLWSFRRKRCPTDLIFSFTYGILNMVEFVLCLITPRFLPFLECNLLISGFRSVYGIFALDIRAWSAFFLQLCLPFAGIFSIWSYQLKPVWAHVPFCLICWTAISLSASSNSSHACTFSFRLGKVINSLFSLLLVK